MKVFWAFVLMLAAACSTYRGQNEVVTTEVKFPGGVYKNLSWKETLAFKRKQFFIGATLYYDILGTRLDESSPFFNWLGSDRAKAKQCDDFYVFMFYRNNRRAIPQASVNSQIEKQGGEFIILQDFNRNIREHYVSDELHLLGHKVGGICFEGTGKVEKIDLFLPGFQETNLL